MFHTPALVYMHLQGFMKIYRLVLSLVIWKHTYIYYEDIEEISIIRTLKQIVKTNTLYIFSHILMCNKQYNCLPYLLGTLNSAVRLLNMIISRYQNTTNLLSICLLLNLDRQEVIIYIDFNLLQNVNMF